MCGAPQDQRDSGLLAPRAGCALDRVLFRGYLPIMSGAAMAAFLKSREVWGETSSRSCSIRRSGSRGTLWIKAAYEQRFQVKRLAALTESARSLGYLLVPQLAPV